MPIIKYIKYLYSKLQFSKTPVMLLIDYSLTEYIKVKDLKFINR